VPKHRDDLTRGLPLPSTWVNALMEFVGTLQSQFDLQQADATHLQVPAGPGNAQVTMAIQGRWRWITATVVQAVPGGAPQTYDVYATAHQNDFSLADPADATDYSFGLTITAAGSPPPATGATALQRLVGHVVWDGTKITSVQQLTPPALGTNRIADGAISAAKLAADVATIPIGGQLPWGGDGDPPGGQFLLADGRLISRTGIGVKFFAACGHKYNLGVDPGGGMVKIPDKRGRGSLGADNMGTAQGAAGRVTVAPHAAGQSGGEERHALTIAEHAPHTHLPGSLVTNTAGSHQHRSATGGIDLVGRVNNGTGGFIVASDASFSPISLYNTATDFAGNHAHSVTGGVTGSSGSGTPFNVLHPFETDNWIVRIA
jgi:hypothetical protein